LLLAPISWFARVSVGLLVVRWDQTMQTEALPVLLAALGTAIVAFDREAARGRVAWFVFAPLLTLATLIVLPKQPPELKDVPTWAALLCVFFVRAPRQNPFRVGWR